MREMTKEERRIFDRKKAIPEMKKRVANFFHMRWEDTEPDEENRYVWKKEEGEADLGGHYS